MSFEHWKVSLSDNYTTKMVEVYIYSNNLNSVSWLEGGKLYQRETDGEEDLTWYIKPAFHIPFQLAHRLTELLQERVGIQPTKAPEQDKSLLLVVLKSQLKLSMDLINDFLDME